MSSKNVKRIYFLLSFFLPILIMSIVYAALNLWPIGDKSLIVNWDIREQYSNYFAYLKTILKGENNFVYSFSKVLGGDIVGLTGYYLSSPFNILFVVFDKLKIDIVVLIITLLKLGFCGFTFYFFISKKFGFNYCNLIFSTSYALMAYNIIYQQNLMWIDGVILLPLVIMGIDKILKNESFLLYVLSLSLAILSNYYIGYMIGIISIIYYLYSMVSEVKFSIKGNFKASFKNFLKFFGYTAISVGSTLFFLLPIFESLEGGKGPDSNSLLNISSIFSPMDFLSKLYTGAFSWHEVMDGFPLIFCGWFITVCFVFFFMNSNISKKERISSFLLITILVLSVQLTTLVSIWHGFNLPTGFPARNSFIFSFFMIYFACKNFLFWDDNKFKYLKFIICSAAFASFFVATKFFKYDYLEDKNYFFSLTVAVFFLLSLLLVNNFKIKSKFISRCIIVAVSLVCFLDLGLNGYISLSKYAFENINDMENFEAKNLPICDYIKQIDEGSFYRIEKNYYRTRNDNMLLNISGTSHYSSCEKNFIKEFMGKLGLDQYGYVYATYGKGGTMLVDGLLGIKYILSSYKINDNYDPIKTFDGITIYKNQNALPVGISACSDVSEVDIDVLNRFDIQNKIISSIAGKNFNILVPYENNFLEIENLNVSVKKGVRYYRKANDRSEAKLKYTITAEDENPIYVDFITPKSSSAKVKINGEAVDFDFSNSDKPILKLGEFKKGDKITIELELLGKRLCIEDILVYKEDVSLLNSVFSRLKEDENRFWKKSSSHLSGDVNVKRNQSNLIFSVPYERSWNVEVDGQKVSTFKVFNTLLAINLSPGHHHIEMKYVPVTFYKGLFVSIISVAAIVFLYIFQVRRSK